MMAVSRAAGVAPASLPISAPNLLPGLSSSVRFSAFEARPLETKDHRLYPYSWNDLAPFGPV